MSTEIATGPPHPLALLQMAVEKGVDAAQLKTLAEVSENWHKNRAAEAFAQAMAECQREMPTILHDAENQHTRSTYARLEAINKVIVPVYTRHGLSIAFGTEDSPLPEHVRIIADVLHQAGHCKRYQADIPLDGTGSQGGKSAMNKPQATGSTYSYGRRYLECMIFNLTIAHEDTDGAGGFITKDQIAEINTLFDSARAAGTPVDSKRFLAWAKADGLDKILAADFPKVIDMLKRKGAK